MTTRMFGAALGVLLGTGTAMAAAPASRGDEAAKHVALVNAELESAEINAKMLREISASDGLYDAAHGKQFVTNMRDSLGIAKAHIAHIAPLATGEREKAHVAALQQHTAAAEAKVLALEAKTADRKAIHSGAGEIGRDVDRSLDPLEDLAKELRVPVDVD